MTRSGCLERAHGVECVFGYGLSVENGGCVRSGERRRRPERGTAAAVGAGNSVDDRSGERRWPPEQSGGRSGERWRPPEQRGGRSGETILAVCYVSVRSIDSFRVDVQFTVVVEGNN